MQNFALTSHKQKFFNYFFKNDFLHEKLKFHSTDLQIFFDSVLIY